MQSGPVTFEDARAIAASVLGLDWAGRGKFMVAPWGYGDDDAWNVIAGAREAIEDGDPSFVMLDDVVYLVDRWTGELTQHHYLHLWERLDLMRPVGEPPPED